MSYKSPFDAALRSLEYRDKTESEIEKYLKKKEFSDEEIEETLIKLKEYNYIDDYNYSIRYIKYAKEKGRGKIRIVQELKNKGVEYEKISMAIEETLETGDERQEALAIALRIIENEDKEFDEKQQNKMIRKLASRGFSSRDVYYVINYIKNIDN